MEWEHVCRGALVCYAKSKANKRLRAELRGHIPDKLYNLWDGVTLEDLLNPRLSIEMHVAARTFHYYSQPKTQRKREDKPGIIHYLDDKYELFDSHIPVPETWCALL